MKKNQVTKYLKPGNYYRLVRHWANKFVLHQIEGVFAPRPNEIFNSPPVFILGAPRSGSTLLFQIISDSFDIGYLTNRQCDWFGFPSIAAPPEKALGLGQEERFESRDGVIEGKHAPSECGDWWYRFFRREPAYVTVKDVSRTQMDRFRRSLLMLQKSSGKPYFFKNLYASLRIGPIKAHIPEALFIVILRNEVDNAISILNGRWRNKGTYDEWWSVPPPKVKQLLGLPPHEQAINQVREINQTIFNDLSSARVPQSDVVFLTYEELCEDVDASMVRVEQMLIRNGWSGTRNILTENTFKSRHQHLKDGKLEEKLRSYSEATQIKQSGAYVT